MHRTAVALVACLALLAACGGDDGITPDADVRGSGVERDTTAPVDSVAPEDTAAPVDSDAPVDTSAPSDDQAIVEAALVTRADFPAGWLEKPQDDTDSPAVLAAQADFRACFGVDSEEFVDLGSARAETGELTSPDGGTIVNSVSLAADQATAEEFMAGTRGDDVVECAADAATALMQVGIEESPELEGAEIGDVVVEPWEVRDIGDEVTGYGVTVPLTLGSQSVDIHIDFIAARVGRGVTAIATQSSGRSVPVNQMEHYLEVSADRLAAQLG